MKSPQVLQYLLLFLLFAHRYWTSKDTLSLLLETYRQMELATGQAYSHCLELQAGTGSGDLDASDSFECRTITVGDKKR
jgi:hypothetical protein